MGKQSTFLTLYFREEKNGLLDNNRHFRTLLRYGDHSYRDGFIHHVEHKVQERQMTNVGDLVILREKYAEEFYRGGAEKELGIGIIIYEFTSPADELFFEVVWSSGHREYVRPSWLKLIKKIPGKSQDKEL